MKDGARGGSLCKFWSVWPIYVRMGLVCAGEMGGAVYKFSDLTFGEVGILSHCKMYPKELMLCRWGGNVFWFNLWRARFTCVY